MKLQAAASRYDAAVAAVQSGADELLLSFWEGSPGEQMADTLKYCLRRGISTVLDLSGQMTDQMLELAEKPLQRLYRRGLSAVLVSEPGAARFVRMTAPDAKLFFSGGVHNLEGVLFAAALGCSRVALSQTLGRAQIEYIARRAPIELQVLALGRLCPLAGSGPCFLGGDAECRLGCRKPYGYATAADGTPLFHKDVSLLGHLQELKEFGVTAIQVASDDRSPEAACVLTKVAREALDGEPPLPRRLDSLSAELGLPGFTDWFYSGAGSPTAVLPLPARAESFLTGVRSEMANRPERACVPVRMYCLIRRDEPARLAVDDYQGHTEMTVGPVAVAMPGAHALEAEANTQWYRLGGTPYRCEEARTRADGGLSLPTSALQDMRREVLAKLDASRSAPPEREAGRFYAGVKLLPRREEPVLTFSLAAMRQLTSELSAMRPACLYLPLSELVESPEKTSALCAAGLTVAAALPRVICDDALGDLLAQLEAAHALGVRQALVYSPGHIPLAVSRGFAVRGEFSATNSQTLKEYKQRGLLSITLSPGLSLGDCRGLSHNMDTELAVYGRIPLLLSGRCLIQAPGGLCRCDSPLELTDEEGLRMPLVRESGHRTLMYAGQKLWMLPYRAQWRQIGLWGARLNFTTENARECVQVAERYRGTGKYVPNQCTTGFYLVEPGSRA